MDAKHKIALFGLQKMIGTVARICEHVGAVLLQLGSGGRNMDCPRYLTQSQVLCVAEHCMVGCNTRQSIGVYTWGTPVDLGWLWSEGGLLLKLVGGRGRGCFVIEIVYNE